MPNHHQPTLLALAVFALLASGPGATAQAVDYVGRIGLYGSPEYARSTDGYENSTLYSYPGGQGSYEIGKSKRYNGANEAGDALWMADLATASTSRIGLFSGSEFTNSSDTSQVTTLIGWRGDTFAYGKSARFLGNEDAGSAAWVALTADRITRRVGFYAGAEFTSDTGRQESAPDLDGAAGPYVTGYSLRYNGTSNYLGQAAWVADSRTGATTRIGLYSDPVYTLSTDGTQSSWATGISRDGHVIGQSERYSGAWSAKVAAWVADASTGTTTRIGLYSGPTFTGVDDIDVESRALKINSRGQILGYSMHFDQNWNGIVAAWVADAATGVTRRIGLYDEPEFTSPIGSQDSGNLRMTESGLIYGISTQYYGISTQYSGYGRAVWVADAATGATTRIGLYGSPEYTDSSSGRESSELADYTESGYAAGISETYNPQGYSSVAVWVADASTGTTKRIGFYTGPEFTDNMGRQESALVGLTESGHVIGYSYRLSGQAAWVADAATGVTTRVGFYNEDFTHTGANYQNSYFEKITESGYIIGASDRYHGSYGAGRATWVADASTGITTRIGLYNEPQYIQPSLDTQYSTVLDVTESGYITGYSQRFDGDSDMGSAQWVAKVTTGVTTRVGVYDAQHTRGDGYQTGEITALTEQGYVAGYSERYNGMADAGRTAWLVDLTDDTQITFEFSVNSATHEAYSRIVGITADGLAYGNYEEYDAGTFLGQRAFLWRKDLGTILLDEAFSLAIAENGWDSLTESLYSDGDYLVGFGQLSGQPASTALFVVAVPEPAAITLLALSATAAAILAARRRLRF